MDVEKQISFWRDGSKDAMIGGNALLQSGQYELALFCCHLAVEKLLKSFVAEITKNHPPYTHNLEKLCRSAEIELDNIMLDDMDSLTSFNIRGRYADYKMPGVNRKTTQYWLKRTQEILTWLEKK